MSTILDSLKEQLSLFVKDKMRSFSGNDLIEVFHDFDGNLDNYAYGEDRQPLGYKIGKTGEIEKDRLQYIRKKIMPLSEQDIINFIEHLLNNILDKTKIKGKTKEFFEKFQPILIKEFQWSIEKTDDSKYFVDAEFIEDKPEVDLSLEQIKESIIKSLDDAKLLIWVAMCWLTDIDILRKLWSKAQEGLDIQIIIYDDKENKNGNKMVILY